MKTEVSTTTMGGQTLTEINGVYYLGLSSVRVFNNTVHLPIGQKLACALSNKHIWMWKKDVFARRTAYNGPLITPSLESVCACCKLARVDFQIKKSNWIATIRKWTTCLVGWHSFQWKFIRGETLGKNPPPYATCRFCTAVYGDQYKEEKDKS